MKTLGRRDWYLWSSNDITANSPHSGKWRLGQIRVSCQAIKPSIKLVPQYKRFWNPGGSIVHTGTYRHSEISHVTDRDNDDSHWLTLTHSLSLRQYSSLGQTLTHRHTHKNRYTHTQTDSHSNIYDVVQTTCGAVQGDQKNVPPLPGRDEKSSRKTEYSIFKYNLFKYYLENFVKNLQN